MNYDHVIEISIDEAEQNPIFSIEYSGPTFNNLFDSEGVNIGVAEININPMRQNTTSGDAIPFVFNFNNFSQRCKSIYTKQIYGLNSWFKPFYSMQTMPQTFA
jgi:hypothetical protein